MSLRHFHLPAWVENHPMFRIAFLFRKLYLTKAKASHYSQFAEDVSILRCFDKNYRGFFVDVGCFHPRKYNNTWQLYRRGWRGINIDLDPIKVKGFDIARPFDINIASAVSNTEGETAYYSKGLYSLMTSLDARFAAGKKGYVKKTTQCKKLSSILDESKYKDREIDFLSVDAEGHDLEGLQSLDFERYKPKLIATETHHPLFREVSETPHFKLLTEKGYCLVGWCGLTLLMANESLQQALVTRRRCPCKDA